MKIDRAVMDGPNKAYENGNARVLVEGWDSTIVHRTFRMGWATLWIWSLPCHRTLTIGPAGAHLLELTEEPATCLGCIAWEPWMSDVQG